MRTLLLLAVLAGLAGAGEITMDGKELPKEFTFTAPSAGYVKLKFISKPEALTPMLSAVEPKLKAIKAEWCEARVPAGELRFSLANQWNAAITGEIRFEVVFTAETDPTEPNEDFDHARVVKLGEPVELAMMPAADRDVLAIDLDEPGYLVATVEGVPEGRTDVRVVFNAGVGKDLGIDLAHVHWPARVYATVWVDWDVWSSTTPFKVTFKLTPEEDPFEPNDSPRDAQVLELGYWHQAVLAGKSDYDWFKVHVDDRAYLLCETEGEGPPRAWELFDAAGSNLLDSGPVLTAQPGDYLVRLSAEWGVSDLRTFRFRVRQIVDPDELEPNDSAPAKIEIGRTYTVALMDKQEVDRFTIDLPGPGYLSVQTDRAPAEILEFRLAVAKGDPLLLGKIPLYVDGGPALVDLFCTWSRIVPQAFQITFDFVPSAGQPQPYDAAHARPLGLGELGEVRIGGLPRNATWFRIEIPSDGDLYVLTSDDPSYPFWDPTVSLVDTNGNTVIDDFNQDPRRPQRAKPVKAGTWFLCVRGDARGTPFHVSAHLVPSGDLAMKPDASGLDFALIGLDADEGTLAALRVLAGASGGSFRNTTEASGLEKELAMVLEASKREADRAGTPPAAVPAPGRGAGSSAWPWLVVVAVVILLVVFLVSRRLMSGGSAAP